MTTNQAGMQSKALEHLRNFATTTTIKGLPKAIKAQTKCQFALWIFALFVGTSITAFQIYNVLRLFMDYGTIDQLSTSSKTAPFPDVTACNLNPLWANDFVKNELNISIPFFNYHATEYYQQHLKADDRQIIDLLLPMLNTAAILQTINTTHFEQDPGSNPFMACSLIDYH